MDDKQVKQKQEEEKGEKTSKEELHTKQSNSNKDELGKLQLECDEYKTRYLRALADYQNFERRVQGEKTEIMKNAQAKILNQLIPFLDNLDKAEMFIKDQGLQMIKNQFSQTLQELGLKEIKLLGTEYDPHTAEVIQVIEGNQDDIIVEVLEKAYEYNGKLLRHGKVKVSKKE